MGDITQYRGRFFSMYGSDPMGLLSWRFEREIAGYGVLGDILAHVTDMALYLNGGVKRSGSAIRIPSSPSVPCRFPAKARITRGARLMILQAQSPMRIMWAPCWNLKMARAAQSKPRARSFGPKNQMAFELNGTKGAISWDFERMNELQLYLPGEDRAHDGFTRLVGGDQYPYHGNFNPGEGSGLGYEDMKVIETFNFLQSVAEGEQRAPGLSEALAVAEVHAAMIRSWESGAWEDVTSLRVD